MVVQRLLVTWVRNGRSHGVMRGPSPFGRGPIGRQCVMTTHDSRIMDWIQERVMITGYSIYNHAREQIADFGSPQGRKGRLEWQRFLLKDYVLAFLCALAVKSSVCDRSKYSRVLHWRPGQVMVHSQFTPG